MKIILIVNLSLSSKTMFIIRQQTNIIDYNQLKTDLDFRAITSLHCQFNKDV
jgi:hypothetical protein